MAQAVSQSTRSNDMTRVQALPFVQNGRGASITAFPKSFWRVQPSYSDSNRDAYHRDYDLGREYAKQLIAATGETQFAGLLDHVVSAMGGDHNAITIGFFHEIG